jgi:hypothetical protein
MVARPLALLVTQRMPGPSKLYPRGAVGTLTGARAPDPNPLWPAAAPPKSTEPGWSGTRDVAQVGARQIDHLADPAAEDLLRRGEGEAADLLR